LKASKLAQTDRLIVALTAVVAEEITQRYKTMMALKGIKKKQQCGCITCFGENLIHLRQLEHIVNHLRKRRITGLSSELRYGITKHLRNSEWLWLKNTIDVDKQASLLLDE
jgi:hypothetical protein